MELSAIFSEAKSDPVRDPVCTRKPPTKRQLSVGLVQARAERWRSSARALHAYSREFIARDDAERWLQGLRLPKAGKTVSQGNELRSVITAPFSPFPFRAKGKQRFLYGFSAYRGKKHLIVFVYFLRWSCRLPGSLLFMTIPVAFLLDLYTAA